MTIAADDFGAGVVLGDKPDQPGAAKPDERFTGLVQQLLQANPLQADQQQPPQEAAEPPAQQPAEDPIVAAPERLVDPAVLAQAVALGIPPDKLFAHDPDKIPAFVQSVADYAAQHQAARQAAATRPAPFDAAARLKQLVETDKWDESLARTVVAQEQRSHELQTQLAQMAQHLAAVQGQAQQAAAAQAGVMWDQQIRNGLASLNPVMASLADNPATLSVVQAKSRELAHMLVASGRPVPDNKALAEQAAMLAYGSDLVQGGRPAFSQAVTPRPQAAPTDSSTGGRAAAVSFISNYLQGKSGQRR